MNEHAAPDEQPAEKETPSRHTSAGVKMALLLCGIGVPLLAVGAYFWMTRPRVAGQWQVGKGISHLALASNGDELYCGTITKQDPRSKDDIGDLIILDVATGEIKHKTPDVGRVVATLAANEETLIAYDEPGTQLRLRNEDGGEVYNGGTFTQTSLPYGRWPQQDLPAPLVMSPNGKHLLSFSSHNGKYYYRTELANPDNSQRFRSLAMPQSRHGEVLLLTFSPDESHIVSIDDRGYAYEFSDADLKEASKPRVLMPMAEACAVSRDRQRLFVCGFERSGETRVENGRNTSHGDAVFVVLESSSLDELWRFTIPQSRPLNRIFAATFLDNDTFAVAGADGNVYLFELGRDQPLVTIAASEKPIHRLAACLDGKHVFVATISGDLMLLRLRR